MSETLKPPSQEFSLPSTEEVIDLIHKLRDLILTDCSVHYKHIRGYGDGQALDVDFPDGSQRELVWIDRGDEEGILAWNDRKKPSVFSERDNYNLIHVDPDKPAVQIAGIRPNKSNPIGFAWVKFVDWGDFCNLLSLAQKIEEA
ncbi:MAG TPA: hypothetical protein VMY36_01740 [Patescibacteria group bacterium]|nr:hypothetical protein [Patescibacteria group bacterium]